MELDDEVAVVNDGVLRGFFFVTVKPLDTAVLPQSFSAVTVYVVVLLT